MAFNKFFKKIIEKYKWCYTTTCMHICFIKLNVNKTKILCKLLVVKYYYNNKKFLHKNFAMVVTYCASTNCHIFKIHCQIYIAQYSFACYSMQFLNFYYYINGIMKGKQCLTILIIRFFNHFFLPQYHWISDKSQSFVELVKITKLSLH